MVWFKVVGDIWVGVDDFGIGLVVKVGNMYVILIFEEMVVFNMVFELVVGWWIEEVFGKGIDGVVFVEKVWVVIVSNVFN